MRLDIVGGDHNDTHTIEPDAVYDALDNCHRVHHEQKECQRTGEGFSAQRKLKPSSKMPLLSSLPTPVLAIAPDAVRHLEGGDALSALWAGAYHSYLDT